MGVLQECYEADCRFHPNAPVGRIRYYFVPWSNRSYFGTNNFFGLKYFKGAYNTDAVGELNPGHRVHYDGHNRHPERDGSHFDGTADDFAGVSPYAGPYAPSRCDDPGGGPHLRIRLFGARLPRRALTGRGGLVIDGAAVLTHESSVVADGGLLLGGAADLASSSELAGDGGLLLGGAAEIVSGMSLAGDGGLLLDGSANLASSSSLQGAGGLLLDGNAGLTHANSVAGSGGFLLDGAGGLAYARSLSGGGGLLIDGAGGLAYKRSLVGGGGVLLGGAATLAFGSSLAGSGGALIDGAASITSAGTKYFLTNSTLATCTTTGQEYALATSAPGSGSVSRSTTSSSFVEVACWDQADTNNHAGTWSVSLAVGSISANAEYRFRVQAIQSGGGCTVKTSSAYSSTFNTTGTKTLSAALGWPAGSDTHRLSLEMRRASGSGTVSITVTLGSSSNVQRLT